MGLKWTNLNDDAADINCKPSSIESEQISSETTVNTIIYDKDDSFTVYVEVVTDETGDSVTLTGTKL